VDVDGWRLGSRRLYDTNREPSVRGSSAALVLVAVAKTAVGLIEQPFSHVKYVLALTAEGGHDTGG
jgi:hypothetical protein